MKNSTSTSNYPKVAAMTMTAFDCKKSTVTGGFTIPYQPEEEEDCRIVPSPVYDAMDDKTRKLITTVLCLFLRKFVDTPSSHTHNVITAHTSWTSGYFQFSLYRSFHTCAFALSEKRTRSNWFQVSSSTFIFIVVTSHSWTLPRFSYFPSGKP